jgi:hypothetical protein
MSAKYVKRRSTMKRKKANLLYKLEFNIFAITLRPEARHTLRDLLRSRAPRRRWIIYGALCD